MYLYIYVYMCVYIVYVCMHFRRICWLKASVFVQLICSVAQAREPFRYKNCVGRYDMSNNK